MSDNKIKKTLYMEYNYLSTISRSVFVDNIARYFELIKI